MLREIQSGDLLFMGLAMGAMLFMILMGPGRQRGEDPQAEERSNAAYLRRFTHHISPILTMALILGLSAVAYGFLAVYFKAL
jgi:hypothetical protein